MATGEHHENPDQDELPGHEKSSGPDVSIRRVVLVRSWVIPAWVHLVDSSLWG